MVLWQFPTTSFATKSDWNIDKRGGNTISDGSPQHFLNLLGGARRVPPTAPGVNTIFDDCPPLKLN